MARNWEDIGIRWSEEPVSRRNGPNASDKVEIGKAQIAVVMDLDKFRAHFGDDCLLGILDGTSIRVMSQDVSRTALSKDRTVTADTIREAIYNRLRGTRNRSTPTVIVKRQLPDGTMYEGNDEAEYRRLYMAGLVDAGVPAEVARTIAEGLKF